MDVKITVETQSSLEFNISLELVKSTIYQIHHKTTLRGFGEYLWGDVICSRLKIWSPQGISPTS